MPQLVRRAVDAVLFGTKSHFAAQAAERRVRQPPEALLHDIDRALDAVITVPGRPSRELLLQLVGIRRGTLRGRAALPTGVVTRRHTGRDRDRGNCMIGEIDVYGVFVPSLVAWSGVALALMGILRRVLARIGFYRLVWHRPLVELSLLVIVLAAVVAVLPSWIAP